MAIFCNYFREVWLVDFEFTAPPGQRPTALCLVARELFSGPLVWQWLAGEPSSPPPYGLGPDTLLVANYASAELGFYLALGWPMPERILDLYAEFRSLTSGLTTPYGHCLLCAGWRCPPLQRERQADSFRPSRWIGSTRRAGCRGRLRSWPWPSGTPRA
jgi:hypothetical protein